jgi:hypothetical protein
VGQRTERAARLARRPRAARARVREHVSESRRARRAARCRGRRTGAVNRLWVDTDRADGRRVRTASTTRGVDTVPASELSDHAFTGGSWRSTRLNP